MSEKRDQADPTSEIVAAAKLVLSEARLVAEAKTSARLRRALGALGAALQRYEKEHS